jgi:hypothetical protein
MKFHLMGLLDGSGHGDSAVHFHAHSHAGETAPHVRTAHAHEHGFRWRTPAGRADARHGGFGGATGTGGLAGIQPRGRPRLRRAVRDRLDDRHGRFVDRDRGAVCDLRARWLTRANRGLQGAVGLATIAIGIMTVVETVLAWPDAGAACAAG